MSTGSFVSAARAGKMTNWAIARPPGQTQALRPVIALHGLGGSASAVMDGGVEQGLAQAVNAGLPPFAVVSVDGGSSYWHQRASGEDAGAMVLNELIPLLDTQRLDTSRVAFLGWSMGGYGALLLGSRLGPARTAAICAVSPALWLSAGSVAPGSFDGPDDWSANSVFGLPALGSIPIRVDCGNSDPFYAATKQFVAQLPHPPAGGFSPGGHNGGFWSAQLPAELTGTYRGYTIHQIPPNGQGIVALIALGILEHFDMSSWSVDSAESVHVQIEALKLAFADAQACVADIDYMPVHPKRLLDKEYLRQRATLIDPKRAMPAATGIPRGGTVYLAAADAAGMMVSMIQSNYLGFGSGVVVPGTGISLHNRGSDFTVVPRHPNRVGPRKRPYHTIIPGFVTRDGAPVMSFGVMGGMMQPQGHVQVLVRIADYGQNPQAACDGPRFCWVNGMRVSFENGFPDSTLDELRQRGHDLVAVADYSQFGSCQAIWRLDDGYLAASDPRRDGQAAAC